MPEAISTRNFVTLPITSQELGRGGLFCPPPPNQIGLSNSPTTIGLIQFLFTRSCKIYDQILLKDSVSLRKNFCLKSGLLLEVSVAEERVKSDLCEMLLCVYLLMF